MAEPPSTEAQAWFARAEDDLRAAVKLMAGNDPLTATAAYHCQQAAEKALKAIIASRDAVIPKTHDLRRLVELCILYGSDFDAVRDACDELTPYATDFRYPTDTPDPSVDEVRMAISLSREVLVTARMNLTASRPPSDGADQSA